MVKQVVLANKTKVAKTLCHMKLRNSQLKHGQANGANKRLALHVRLRCGSLSNTKSVPLLANYIAQPSELGSCQSNLCTSWGYEWLQKILRFIKGWLPKCKYNCNSILSFIVYLLEFFTTYSNLFSMLLFFHCSQSHKFRSHNFLPVWPRSRCLIASILKHWLQRINHFNFWHYDSL